jgi:hypothetical protein
MKEHSMNVKALVSSVLIVAMAQSAGATSLWGKIKNTFNDCKYTDQDRPVIDMEKLTTVKLTDNISAQFSMNDFNEKPWMRDFRYVIVVNKAEKGPNRQTLRIFENGYLVLTTKVSTGREGFELKRKNQVCAGAPPRSYWSNTPTGYYTPKFLSIDHKSSSWDSDMPFAVFFDVENGLALHQAYPKYEKYLGSRASGGCVRLANGVAEDVFNRIALTEGSNAPLVNKDGTPVLDAEGKVTYATSQIWVNPKSQRVSKFKNYSALIIVENNPGK